jgi:hypothetical protein
MLKNNTTFVKKQHSTQAGNGNGIEHQGSDVRGGGGERRV